MNHFCSSIFSRYSICIVIVLLFALAKYSQHDVPPGKHALITVKQAKGNLLWIQTPKSTANTNKKKNIENQKFIPHLTTWDDCDVIQVSASGMGREQTNSIEYIVRQQEGEKEREGKGKGRLRGRLREIYQF